MSAVINITISPLSSGNTEIFKNDVSLGVVSSSLQFIFDIDDVISLSSTPNSGYEFLHYTLPNGNESTDELYEDTITTDDEKDITVVFKSISTTQKYSCIEGVCEEDSDGEFVDSNCNDTCTQETPEDNSTIKNVLMIAGVGVILWTLFRKSPKD